MEKKQVVILGSTGSVGKNALEVLSLFPDKIKVAALSAKKNAKLLTAQAKRHRPGLVVIYDSSKASFVKKALPFCKVLTGDAGLREAVTMEMCDQVLFAMSGSKAISPCIEAIKAKKRILLANKEILVAAGSLIMKLAKEKGVTVLPVDSEHSAIHQCLRAGKKKEVAKVILTASGGPFLHTAKEKLESVCVEDALNHPKWKMGSKISVDSSTLMNKGLEVIEASHLFNLPEEKISVVIHEESIVHSMVAFQDASIIAQLAKPDMKLPLQYAFFYPERRKLPQANYDWIENMHLTFSPPDTRKFPCLSFALSALREKSSFACTLNAANEELVELFLQRKISWKEIALRLEKILSLHAAQNMLSLEDILMVDEEARRLVKEG